MNWPQRPLGELCSVVAGGTPSRTARGYFGGEVPWVKIGDMLNDPVTQTEETITQEGLANSSAKLIPAGTLLISIFATIGRTAILNVEAATNQAIAAVRPRAGVELETPYLRRFLDFSVQQLTRQARGVAQVNINGQILKQLPIPLPPPAEQRRVASILDAADRLRRQRAEAVRLAGELVPSLFAEMFGDVTQNDRSWPTRRMSEVATLDRGRSRHRPRNAPELYGGPYPFVQTGDVTNADGVITSYSQTYSEAGLAQSRLWPVGTLCITIAANIAQTATLTFDACFPDSVVGLVPGPDLCTDYARQWFVCQQSRLEQAASQVAQKNINLDVLNNLVLPVPPKHIQDDFANKVDAVRRLHTAQTNSARELDALFASLQDRAFRGEL